MAGAIPSSAITYIGAGAAVTSAGANAPTSTLLTPLNNHLGGTAYRHGAGEIDTATTDDGANPTTPTTAGTDQATRNLQTWTMIARIIGGAAGTGAATRYGTITPGVNDLTTLATAIAGATSATANSLAKRDANAGFSVGYLTAVAPTGAITPVAARAAGAASQALWVGQTGAAGNAITSIIDSLGNGTFTGTLVAGSGAVGITSAAGNLIASALAGTIPASTLPQFTGGDVTTSGTGSVALSVGKVGGAAATNVALAAAAFAGVTVSNPATNLPTPGTALVRDAQGSGYLYAAGVQFLQSFPLNNTTAGVNLLTTPSTSAAGLLDATKLGNQVPVANGGTGLATAAANGVLYGAGTAAFGVTAAGVTGQYLRATSNAAPAWSALNASDLSGQVSVGAGGTGANTLTAYAVLLGAGTQPLQVAAPGAAGTYLRSTGPTSNPAFQALGASDLSGIVAVANGGTGASTLAANALLTGNGTSAVGATLAPGTAGTYLRSTGSAWAATAFQPGDIPAQSLPFSTILDLSLTTTTSSLAVTLNTGAGAAVVRTDTGGVLVGVGQQVTLTATNAAQYIPLYIDNTGTLNTGTPQTSLALATFPGTAAYYLDWAYLPANCTGLYPSPAAYQAAGNPAGKGYLMPRPLASGAGGGAGGSGSTSNAFVVAAPLATQATMQSQTNVSSAANLLDLLNGNYASGANTQSTVNGQNLAAALIAPTLVRASANDAPVVNAAQGYVQPDLRARLNTANNGTQVTLAAGANGSGPAGTPMTIALYGTSGVRVRTNTAQVTTASLSGSAAGQYQLLADLSAAATGFTIALIPFGSTINAYQTVLRYYYWDGTALHVSATGDFVSDSPQGTVSTIQSRLQTIEAHQNAYDSAFTSTSAVTKPANMNRVTFTLAENAQAFVCNRATGQFNQTAVGGFLYCVACFDDQTSGPQCAPFYTGAPSLSASGVTFATDAQYWNGSSNDLMTLAAGTHTLTQLMSTAAPAQSDLYMRSVRVLFFYGGN